MSRLIALPCLALLGLLSLARAAPALAQSEIHHCIGAQGGPVFTDQPCAALNATPVGPAAAAASPSLSDPLPVLCATTVDQLRQSVIAAFARRDSVRMAGLILWEGYGRGAAIADLRALTASMKQTLLDVDTPLQPAEPASADGDDGFAPPAEASAPADQLVLHTAGGRSDGAAPEWRFDIVRRAGCLWLRNAN